MIHAIAGGMNVGLRALLSMCVSILEQGVVPGQAMCDHWARVLARVLRVLWRVMRRSGNQGHVGATAPPGNAQRGCRTVSCRDVHCVKGCAVHELLGVTQTQ